MTEGQKVTLIMVLLLMAIALLFGTGAFHKFNDWYDKKSLESEYGEKGELIMKGGLKYWKQEGN